MSALSDRIRSEPSLPSSVSDSEFDQFRKLSFEATGIELSGSKRSMIYTRFIRRLRTLKLQSFSEYLEIAANRNGQEFENFVNTITTNLTYFFREPHHFDYLRDTAIPTTCDANKAAPIRIWSAGCSSGEEPYSIAMVLAEASMVGENDYRLLCTDIDSQMVGVAERGIYKSSELRGLDSDRRAKWLVEKGSREVEIAPALKRGMICRKHNLFEPVPIRPGVDIIFCRNALIYFDKDCQEKVISAFAKVQCTGHYLFLGHSESLRGFEKMYNRVSNTVYQRI